MKRILFSLALVASLPATQALASNVDFNVGINIGTRPPVVAPAVPVPVPVPVPAPPPVYVDPDVDFEEPPLFIEPPELGFHVAVGIPFNVFYVGANYYLCKGNVWYSGPSYRGPWVVTRYRALPWKLRKHSFERVRYYRDAGYRHYREGRDPYWRAHNFRPNKEWKQARKWEKEQRKQDWKHARGGDDSWNRGGHGDRGGHGRGRD